MSLSNDGIEIPPVPPLPVAKAPEVEQRKVSDLTPEEYEALSLDVARSQRLEAYAEEDARQLERKRQSDAEKTRKAEEKARKAEATKLPPYDCRFGFMSMITLDNLISVVIPMTIVSALVFVLWQYLVNGVNMIDRDEAMPEGVPLMYGAVAATVAIYVIFKLMTIIAHYRYDTLKVEDGQLVYTPPRIIWLFMFGGDKSAKKIMLSEAATGNFQQNPIESIFKMDSTSVVLDTAGVESKVFKKLRGVRKSLLLKRHLGKND